MTVVGVPPGAIPESVTVPKEEFPPTTVTGFGGHGVVLHIPVSVTLTSVGAATTASVADFCDPFSVAMIMALAAVPIVVSSVKVVLVVPAGTVTDALLVVDEAKVTEGSLLVSMTELL